MRRTRAAVAITRGRQGSLGWCPDPGKQQRAADTFDVTTSSQSSEPHLSAAQGSRKIK